MKKLTDMDNEKMKISDWIITKNNQFLALNKIPGIPVQNDKTNDLSLLSLAQIYSKCTLFPVHRIDRPTSGLVLFAKTKGAIKSLNAQLQKRTIDKSYLAVVKNKPKKKSGKLVHYLRKNGKTNKSIVHEEPIKGAQEAVMEYELIDSIENYHLLEIKLITGRHHQIRAQLGFIDNPVRGDVKYGFRRSNKDRSIHLHAWKMSFKHPVTGKKIDLEAAIPDDSIWNAFKIKSSLANRVTKSKTKK